MELIYTHCLRLSYFKKGSFKDVFEGAFENKNKAANNDQHQCQGTKMTPN